MMQERCPARQPVTDHQCGMMAGHDGPHTILTPTGVPWFGMPTGEPAEPAQRPEQGEREPVQRGVYTPLPPAPIESLNLIPGKFGVAPLEAPAGQQDGALVERLVDDAMCFAVSYGLRHPITLEARAKLVALATRGEPPLCPSCRHEPMERQWVCEHCGHREAMPDA